MAPVIALLRHNLPGFDTRTDLSTLSHLELQNVLRALTLALIGHWLLLGREDRSEYFFAVIRREIVVLLNLLSAVQQHFIGRFEVLVQVEQRSHRLVLRNCMLRRRLRLLRVQMREAVRRRSDPTLQRRPRRSET